MSEDKTAEGGEQENRSADGVDTPTRVQVPQSPCCHKHSRKRVSTAYRLCLGAIFVAFILVGWKFDHHMCYFAGGVFWALAFRG